MHPHQVKESYLQLFIMALGLAVTLPFIFARRAVKFLQE